MKNLEPVAPEPTTGAAPASVSAGARRPAAGDRRQPTRGRSAIHVDLGDALKSDLASAAARAGLTPSDWVRAALRRAVDAGAPVAEGGAVVPTGRSVFPDAAPRPVAVHLAADDIALIDAAVEAGGFRSRPAALRFLLRSTAVDGGAALKALRSLSGLIPLLADSNTELRSLCRRLQAGEGRSAEEAQQRVDEHLLLVSQAVAALRPLLAVPASGGSRRSHG